MMIDRIRRLACEPLVHFLAIGAFIYGTYAQFGEKPAEELAAETIRVTAGDVARMADSGQRNGDARRPSRNSWG